VFCLFVRLGFVDLVVVYLLAFWRLLVCAFVDFILDFGGFTIVGFGCFQVGFTVARLSICSFLGGFTDSRFCL